MQLFLFTDPYREFSMASSGVETSPNTSIINELNDKYLQRWLSLLVYLNVLESVSQAEQVIEGKVQTPTFFLLWRFEVLFLCPPRIQNVAAATICTHPSRQITKYYFLSYNIEYRSVPCIPMVMRFPSWMIKCPTASNTPLDILDGEIGWIVQPEAAPTPTTHGRFSCTQTYIAISLKYTSAVCTMNLPVDWFPPSGSKSLPQDISLHRLKQSPLVYSMNHY